MPFGVNPQTGRPGPTPKAARSGDKLQARAAVNIAIKNGTLPRPSTLECIYCGRLGGRHEYHHHRGYDAEYHLDVIPLCTKCHHAEDNANAAKTHCVKGHHYTPETTGYHADGRRHCLACRRERDAPRRDAAWWRAYRLKRKDRQDG